MDTAAFADYLMSIQNLMVVAAVWVLLSTVKRVFPRINTHRIWARFAPVAPILLCSIAVWIPGVVNGGIAIGSRILLGIVLGAMSANAHKILRQTALGNDERIKPKG